MTNLRTLMICLGLIIITIPAFAKDANVVSTENALSVSGYPLSIKETVRLALSKNYDIQIAKLQRKINAQDVTAANAIYDTTLSAEFGYTVDESESSSTFAADKENTTVWNVGLSKKFSFGSLLSFDFGNTRKSTSSTTSKYYTATDAFSLRHPLLKNSFGKADRYGIRIVELDISQLNLNELTKIENTLAAIKLAYWDLAFAQKLVTAKTEALEYAEHFLEITEEQVKNGALEETDLFAAQANVENSKRELLEAKNSVSDLSHNLKLLMNLNTPYELRATEEITVPESIYSSDNSLSTAMQLRRDLIAAKEKAERYDIDIKLQKNSTLPQLDFLSTLTANGLDRELENSLGEAAGWDDPTYFVGLELSYPLENRTAKSAKAQSIFKKAQALQEIIKTENTIVADIAIATDKIRLKFDQSHLDFKTAELQEKKLLGEEKKYKFGRSSSDLIIRYETDMINAKVQLNRTLTEYRKAIITLKQKENSLLQNIDLTAYEEA